MKIVCGTCIGAGKILNTFSGAIVPCIRCGGNGYIIVEDNKSDNKTDDKPNTSNDSLGGDIKD